MKNQFLKSSELQCASRILAQVAAILALSSCIGSSAKVPNTSKTFLSLNDSAPTSATLSFQAAIANLTYLPPITISQGGTYTGNYRSPDRNTPAININTTAPVIIENCNLTGPGDLIRAVGNVDVIIRGCNGYGIPVANGEPGRFANFASAKRAWVLNNYFELVAEGASIYQFSGDGSPSQSIRILNNVGRNMTNQGFGTFIGLNQVHNVPNIEIAWNQLINEPNKGSQGDSLNVYNSSGTSSSPINIHDNYVQGSYPDVVTGSDFTGTGMTTDGSGDGDFTKLTAFVDAHHNTFVSNCNAAMNNSSSHDVHFHDNRMVTSSVLPDGTKLNSTWAATAIFNGYSVPANWMYNNVTDHNVIGYVRADGNRADYSPGACAGCVNNTFLPNPITSNTEKNEWSLFNQKLIEGGIRVGSNEHFNRGNQAAGNGINPFWPTTVVVAPVPSSVPIPAPSSMPTYTPAAPASISGIVLINAGANLPQPLSGVAGSSATLSDGAIIDLTKTGNALNVRADCVTCESVLFELDQGAISHIENVAPYALASDTGGIYNSWTPTLGNHVLKITPYSGTAAGGNPGNSTVLQFSVVRNVITPPLPAPQPGSVPPSGAIRLVSKTSGKCADVYGDSRANGGNMVQWSCNSQSNQLFTFLPAGNGLYQIKVKSSGKCLDVWNASASTGAVVNQYDCSGPSHLNQLFSIGTNSSGNKTLIAAHSKKCIDVGSSSLNGEKIQQVDCALPSQRGWSF
ncbi:MAG: RICIN domain-containing protein [Cryobacterium sp.]|nr:RICIN domain-containing protein [Oligoflexia bacterium]